MAKSVSVKRLRTRKACLPCRQRKRKCDGELPCGMCTAYSYHCQYDKEDGHPAHFVQMPAPYVVNAERRAKDEVELEKNGITGHVKKGILDPSKSRYMSLNSAIAFPRALGLELNSTNPPHLHSFAWNCGVRPEENTDTHPILPDIVSQGDCLRFVDTYFAVVHPVFAVVDRKQIEKSIGRYWDSRSTSAFGAVIAGIMALGSFFSGDHGHPRETDMVHYAKGVLEDPKYSRLPTVEQVSAWVLRTIYLRATTRPHTAWLASCVTIHLAEATALHHEAEEIELTTSSLPDQAKSERARRLFWTAWSINSILSYDYGRSCVALNTTITCLPATPTKNNYTFQLAELAHLIPQEKVNSSNDVQVAQLLSALERIHEMPEIHPFISLTKADLALSFYRRLRLLNHLLDSSVVRQIVDIGDVALTASVDLVQRNHVWWNVLSASFQYVCALMAIDTRESLARVVDAKKILGNIVTILGTHIAREAEATVELLLRDSVKKKRHEIALLEGATLSEATAEVMQSPEINWDILLDPSYTLDYMQRDFSNF
ncbi:LANO_0F09472g1_1 [Lachancea nothofagi CBS 11611]|uniref:LANO_0F09472g1_1 n=1 Tax=Lachancea nothofagi CBS 11611 TaxID=1266666 RepID=A0A1G4KA05_9SACH|nr:LANO_0F09472g1_1 [Lachancea nothofagi CBS 11611]